MPKAVNLAVERLLADLDIQPVLVDVGASGSPPSIWDPIASSSVYVGFDPDLREPKEVSGGRFLREVTLDLAVTTSGSEGEVPFFLTRYPHSSSTLRPDLESLSDYLFVDLFEIESETKVKAGSLASVLEQLGLGALDWLKSDSQGTDLRIFLSIPQDVRARVLALDIEPGLIDAYLGEDLFVDAHRELMSNHGFWLSWLQVRGAVRMRRRTAERAAGVTPEEAARSVRESPGWVEARYLRKLPWLASNQAAQREYVLLWTFAILDGQFGFALDVAADYRRLFGEDGVSRHMIDHPVGLIKGGRYAAQARSLAGRVLGKARRLLS